MAEYHPAMKSKFTLTFGSIGERASVRIPGIQSVLHCLAGALLLVFASSHFAFLGLTGFEGRLRNSVFPFLTNNNLYCAAGGLEWVTALVCFKFHGRPFTNVFILAFVTVMLLYRWAFNFTGGTHCACLGLFAKLLHIDNAREKTLANLALLCLAITTTPWVYSGFPAQSRRFFSTLTLLVMIALPSKSAADGSPSNLTIQIYGGYTATAQNPATGKAYLDYRHVRAAFVAVLSGPAWIICVTNLSTGSACRLWCDGTNTFALQPADAIDFDTFNLTGGSKSTNVVTISPTLYYVETIDPDYLDVSLPWLTYGLNPSAAAQGEDKGIVALPVPWLQPRSKPSGYGYKWDISWAGNDGQTDMRFAQTLTVARDRSLDVDTNAWLLRKDLLYPVSLPDYNRALDDLSHVISVKDGFVEAKFQCLHWYTEQYASNDIITVPDESEFECFAFSPRRVNPFPYFKGELSASRIVVLEGPQDSLHPGIQLTTRVLDFRYRRVNATHIYRMARYTLQAGEAWKSSDDPALLAEAAYYLRHGPRYDTYVTMRNYLVWVLFGVILVTPVIVMLISKRRNK